MTVYRWNTVEHASLLRFEGGISFLVWNMMVIFGPWFGMLSIKMPLMVGAVLVVQRILIYAWSKYLLMPACLIVILFLMFFQVMALIAITRLFL